MIEIGKLQPGDRAAWETLFRGYIDFYERTLRQEDYDRAWTLFQEDDRLHALGARVDGVLVGITHFFVHANTSGPDVCYLQDLFTARDLRDWAREHGCCRLYWMTHESNATARRLYDKVAENRGFIRYQIELG